MIMRFSKNKHAQKRTLLALVAMAAIAVMAFCIGCSSASPGEASNQQTNAASGTAEQPTSSAQSEESQLVSALTPDVGVSYSLYFGLIDKDTGAQELSTDKYRDIIAAIFVDAGVGYTVYEAFGAYPLEDGTVVENVTLVFTGVHGTEDAIKALIDQAQKELNIESVYCESYLHGYGISGGVVNALE